MANEPVMWVRAQHKGQFRRPRVWDESKKRWVQPVDEFDRPLVERVPAKGYIGNDLANMRLMPGQRFVDMVRDSGDTVACPLSTGASLRVRDDEHKADRLRKFRFCGWFPVGCCPAREAQKGFRGGGIGKNHLLSKVAREGRPCEEHEVGDDNPPCEHYLAEVAARKARNKAVDEKTRLAYKDADEKKTELLGTLVEHLVAKESAPAPKGGPTK